MLTPASEAATPHSFSTGFDFPSTQPGEQTSAWLDRTVAASSSVVRINVSWAGIAPPTPQPGFDAANPASSGYRWERLDAAVREATARRLRIMFTVSGAPGWAEDSGRPASIRQGAWRPQAGAYGAFGHALAVRYSGSYPDPLIPGASLPRVRYFEVWNEPNLDTYLAPQWQGNRPVGVAIYRDLLNSFYAAVKAVQPAAKVIAGSLAPFGDPPGGHRTTPVQFLRNLLCLRGWRLEPVKCPHPARFDVLSDHPIAVGPPSQSALSSLNVTTPNLGRLTRILRKAEQTRRVLPRGHKPLWVTEFWYDSSPPDPDGVPLYRQARWYEQDLFMFWRQGARVAIGLQLHDSPPGKGYPFTSQSGIFFLDGTPKPSYTAFRFPLVASRLGPDSVLVWGIAPHPGRVKVQARRGGRWDTLAVLRARGRSRPFTVTLHLRRPVSLRAQLGGEQSLIWRQG